ncbi:hypothetical protein E2C01_032736 [Portunus trituberculatus]|uniref:Uncharacterized protein n=1 Tax=Portunus trituberculatus TaxID=210409 RepID=A0A5B7EW13_PORTR|nr:hypothetical protein [Portunus trituberculatus]
MSARHGAAWGTRAGRSMVSMKESRQSSQSNVAGGRSWQAGVGGVANLRGAPSSSSSPSVASRSKSVPRACRSRDRSGVCQGGRLFLSGRRSNEVTPQQRLVPLEFGIKGREVLLLLLLLVTQGGAIPGQPEGGAVLKHASTLRRVRKVQGRRGGRGAGRGARCPADLLGHVPQASTQQALPHFANGGGGGGRRVAHCLADPAAACPRYAAQRVASAVSRGQRRREGTEILLLWAVFVVWVLEAVQDLEPLRLLTVGAPLLLRQKLPPAAQLLGNLCVVHVGGLGDDLPPLQLRPHHEGVHGPLHVARQIDFTDVREDKESADTLIKTTNVPDLTCVASEYGVGEASSTSSDPNTREEVASSTHPRGNMLGSSPELPHSFIRPGTDGRVAPGRVRECMCARAGGRGVSASRVNSQQVRV